VEVTSEVGQGTTVSLHWPDGEVAADL
jgi:signal transduction histidine kinase